MRLPTALALVIPLVASCGLIDGAAPELHDCTISGKVVDGSGAPVEAAIGITPDPDPYSDIGYSADEVGRFHIAVDCGTRYTLSATRDGAPGEEKEVTVDEGEMVVQLVLPRSGD